MSIVFNGHTVAGAPPPSDTANAAKKADLTSIIATGATNATGATITSGTYFYLNGSLVVAKADIASGATFTENTNYEAVTAGGLNSLKSALNYKSGDTISLSGMYLGMTNWLGSSFVAVVNTAKAIPNGTYSISGSISWVRANGVERETGLSFLQVTKRDDSCFLVEISVSSALSGATAGAANISATITIN